VISSLLVFVILTSCNRQPAGSEIVTLRFWNGFTGPDGRTMLALVKKFNESHPKINVVMQRMDWGTYYNKLYVAGLGGRSPQVFVIHTDSLLRFRRANLLRNVDELFGTNGLDADDFDEGVRKGTEDAGKHYGVPLDIHMLGMFYNKALFRDAGIVDSNGEAKPPTNRAEFLDALRKLKRDTNNDGRPEQWGFTFTWHRTNCFAILSQFGGEFFNPDRTHCTLDSPANRVGMQFCADLIGKEKLAPSPENFDAWIGFRQGKVGIVLEGIYQLPDLLKQHGLEYGAAPVPILGEKAVTWANSHNLCLRPNLSAEELDASKTFIKFLSDNSLDWAAAGQVPVRKSLRGSDRFAAMTVQRAFARQIPYARYMPSVPFTNEYLEKYEFALERILRGSATPEDALREASVAIDQIIARYQAADDVKGAAE